MTDAPSCSEKNSFESSFYTMQKMHGDAQHRVWELETSMRLIAEHPVDDSKQWEVACKEMKKVARLALKGKTDD